jgi:hypothetical protein
MLDGLAGLESEPAVGVAGLRQDIFDEPAVVADGLTRPGGAEGEVWERERAALAQSGISATTLARTASAEHRIARERAEQEAAVHRHIHTELEGELAAVLREISAYDMWGQPNPGADVLAQQQQQHGGGPPRPAGSGWVGGGGGHRYESLEAARQLAQPSWHGEDPQELRGGAYAYEEGEEEEEEEAWDPYEDYAEAHEHTSKGKRTKGGGGGGRSSGAAIYSQKHIRRKQVLLSKGPNSVSNW